MLSSDNHGKAFKAAGKVSETAAKASETAGKASEAADDAMDGDKENEGPRETKRRNDGDRAPKKESKDIMVTAADERFVSEYDRIRTKNILERNAFLKANGLAGKEMNNLKSEIKTGKKATEGKGKTFKAPVAAATRKMGGQGLKAVMSSGVRLNRNRSHA